MPKLNQILAIEKQTKTSAHERLTAIYQTLQKETLLSGISRTYEPLQEDGERFPPELQQVQVRAEKMLAETVEILSPLFDITAQRDLANCLARADVEVDGKVVLKDVPAVTLLWLEKQLIDLLTLVSKLPELPQAETWIPDDNQDCYATPPVQTAKTKKIPKPFVKYEATKEHPAQVEVVHEDVVQGYWTNVKFSGAMPRNQKRALRERTETLLAAVRFAREKANLVDVPRAAIAKDVFAHLFAPRLG